MEGKIGVGAAEASNEVVLEGGDCALCWVGAMIIGGNKLEDCIIGGKIRLHSFGAFVVEYVIRWVKVRGCDALMEMLSGANELMLGAVLDGFAQDGVGILDEHDHDVFVAETGGLSEAASLISSDFTGDCD